MAHSLEGRVPFLDHRLVEFTAPLETRYKIRRMVNKVLLRRAMKGILPEEVAKRKKAAFFIPVESCFRDDFFGFVEEVLSKASVDRRGYFRYNFVRGLLDRYRGNPGELLYSKQVMALTILELWHQAVLDRTEQPRSTHECG